MNWLIWIFQLLNYTGVEIRVMIPLDSAQQQRVYDKRTSQHCTAQAVNICSEPAVSALGRTINLNAPCHERTIQDDEGTYGEGGCGGQESQTIQAQILIGKITLNCMYLCHAATSSLGIGMCTILVSDSHAHSMYLFASENGACTAHHCLCGNFGRVVWGLVLFIPLGFCRKVSPPFLFVFLCVSWSPDYPKL